MLDLVYIGLVVLPLMIAAVALLLLAWRGVRGDGAAEPSAAPRSAPRVAPRPSLADLSQMVESRAAPAATKRCPDCAEEVLAAARVCKHCRYRWDEPDYRASLSA